MSHSHHKLISNFCHFALVFISISFFFFFFCVPLILPSAFPFAYGLFVCVCVGFFLFWSQLVVSFLCKYRPKADKTFFVCLELLASIVGSRKALARSGTTLPKSNPMRQPYAAPTHGVFLLTRRKFSFGPFCGAL